jgi:hypothetical protein
VSDNIHFYPVPTELVQIEPHWRGYEFIPIDNQIIVNPQTHQMLLFSTLDDLDAA